MSTVVIDIDEQYCDELMYGYQLIRQDDDTYRIWISTGPLRGCYTGGTFETLSDAFNHLVNVVREKEYLYE